MEQYLPYLFTVLFVLILLVFQYMHQRESKATREFFSGKIDKMITEYENLTLKFMAVSQADKANLFEIEKMKVEVEARQVEGQNAYIENETKRLEHLRNTDNSSQMDNRLRELREQAKRNLKPEVTPTQDI